MKSMQALFAAFLLLVAPWSWADQAASVKGTVLEVQDAGGYTYLLLKTSQGDTWTAVNRAAVKKGAEVTIENTMTMLNFESKALKKTFPTILFGNLAGASAPRGMGGIPAGLTRTTDITDVKVAKASGANAKTVAEVISQSATLNGKTVQVRAKVVKFNGDIMGKNWLHLRDGTGSAAADTHDLLATSASEAKPGDVVTVQGVVRTNKDFGAGYRYKVLIEDATLRR